MAGRARYVVERTENGVPVCMYGFSTLREMNDFINAVAGTPGWEESWPAKEGGYSLPTIRRRPPRPRSRKLTQIGWTRYNSDSALAFGYDLTFEEGASRASLSVDPSKWGSVDQALAAMKRYAEMGHTLSARMLQIMAAG